MIEILKKYWWVILVFILSCIIVILYNKSSNNIVYLNDTTIVTRYETKLQKDTVINWLDKIIYKWKETKPEIVYYQKVDTVFIEKTKDLDLILQAELKGNKLKIIAVNQNGKVIKERYFDVYGDFIATSTVNDVFVKTQVWKFYGNANLRLHSKISDIKDYKSYDIKPSIEFGVKWKDNIGISIEPIYNLTNGSAEIQLNFNKKLF